MLDYAVNKRKLYSAVLECFYDLLMAKRPSYVIDKVIAFAINFKSAIRPNRTFERRFSSCKRPVGYRKNFCGSVLA